MKIVVETSMLVSASIYWEYEDKGRRYSLKHKFHDKCMDIFSYAKNKGMEEYVIITKTVENEAKNALNKAVKKAIKDSYVPGLTARYGLMVLQHLVTNTSLDMLEYYVEECSARLPINTNQRNAVKHDEIEPFMKRIILGTLRYIQPAIPAVVRDPALRDELTQIIVRSLPSKGTIYKGLPGDKDLTIMAEATMIYRKFHAQETVYVASVDNHFKPNPVQVGSFLSRSVTYTGELDSTIRDELADKFGFVGEDPKEIIKLMEKEWK
jgi:hypothetical protein